MTVSSGSGASCRKGSEGEAVAAGVGVNTGCAKNTSSRRGSYRLTIVKLSVAWRVSGFTSLGWETSTKNDLEKTGFYWSGRACANSWGLISSQAVLCWPRGGCAVA